MDGGVADVMHGGTGNDTYVVDGLGDLVYESAGGGIDSVLASIAYTLGAGVENLELTGTAAINGSGNDVANTIKGNASANTLNGGAGDDTLYGRSGNDRFIYTAGTDSIDGGDGSDTADFSAFAGAVQVTLSTVGYDVWTFSNGDWHALAEMTQIENVVSGAGSDTIEGDAGDNIIDGGGGHDTLRGFAGNDRFIYTAGTDSIDGGDGSDTADFSRVGTLMQINLTTLDYDVWTQSQGWLALADMVGIENVIAGSAGDIVYGDAGANVIDAGAGNDQVYCGAGDDTFVYATGTDTVDGERGSDTANFSGVGSSALQIDLSGSDYDVRLRTSGEPLALLFNVENIIAGGGADHILGDASDNRIEAGGGDDTINAGAGGNTLYGGAGNDVFVHAGGFDWAHGGAGSDTADFSAVGSRLEITLSSADSDVWMLASGSWVALADMLEVENVVGGNLGRSYRLRLVDEQDAPFKLLSGRFMLRRDLVETHLVQWYIARAKIWLRERCRTTWHTSRFSLWA
jgi:Ca2+-binding RTX toxin-like protein